MGPDPTEIRVLGCLIEKQRATPDAYPLTLNSLRLACNQSTGRDPVVDYSDGDVRSALDRLGRRGWTRNASWAGSRAMKYKQVVNEALRLSEPEVSLLGVLMLRGAQTPGELKGRTERRGAQTPGELKGRTERLHRFGSLPEVEETLNGLIERELVTRLPRRPGQKEERYVQLLGEGEPEEAPVAPAAVPESPPDRLAELERRLTAVEDELRALREELG